MRNKTHEKERKKKKKKEELSWEGENRRKEGGVAAWHTRGDVVISGQGDGEEDREAKGEREQKAKEKE